MRNSRLVLAVPVMLCAGCTQPGAYWGNRWFDFRDCFTLEVGVWGKGIDVDLHLTDWIATGVGGAVSSKYGFAGRRPVGDWDWCNDEDSHIGFPVLPVVLLARGAEWVRLPAFLRTDCGERKAQVGAIHGRVDIKRTSSILFVNVLAFTKNRGRNSEPKLIDAFDVDVGATFLRLSTRAGFSFGQFADFVLGFFGLDIAGEDVGASKMDSAAEGGP
jgi:hypothetical protein